MHFVEVVVGGILGSEALGGSWPSHVPVLVLRPAIRGGAKARTTRTTRCVRMKDTKSQEGRGGSASGKERVPAFQNKRYTCTCTPARKV